MADKIIKIIQASAPNITIGQTPIHNITISRNRDGKDFKFEDFTPEQLELIRGYQGEIGPVGPQGPKGDKGDNGDKGEQGIQGPKGEDGQSFTYDMFTPEQLAELGRMDVNAASASKLETPRTISLTGKAVGSTTFDGSDNASINVTSVNADTATDADKLDGYHASDLIGMINNNQIEINNQLSTHNTDTSAHTDIRQMFNNYVDKTGTGASGTWGINISGTATKATQDGNGANISETYLKKAGDTVTGTLNVPTPATTDNSTIVANTAFVQSTVDNKVSQLVNSAPETLDTLNELSNALGNDPNFATTVSNMIGQKLSKAGDTITGPILYSNTPNDDTELPNKAYVDSAINSAVASAVTSVTKTLSDNMHAQYPVGSYIYSDKADNPATYLPYMSDTTWVQTAKGRVLIGAGTADSGTVYTEGQTGGEEKHKLTISELAAHYHEAIATSSGTNSSNVQWAASVTGLNTANSGATFTFVGTQTQGGSQAHNNMQPYEVVNIWKRID